jgi:hypothetical protein
MKHHAMKAHGTKAQLHASATLPLGKESTLSIRKEDIWVPKTIWTWE